MEHELKSFRVKRVILHLKKCIGSREYHEIQCKLYKSFTMKQGLKRKCLLSEGFEVMSEILGGCEGEEGTFEVSYTLRENQTRIHIILCQELDAMS